jgi:hypothetical protein
MFFFKPEINLGSACRIIYNLSEPVRKLFPVKGKNRLEYYMTFVCEMIIEKK